jgi:hypothetical protein
MSLLSKSAPTLKAEWDTSIMPSGNVPTAGRISANKKRLIATSERTLRLEPTKEWVAARGEERFSWEVIERYHTGESNEHRRQLRQRRHHHRDARQQYTAARPAVRE